MESALRKKRYKLLGLFSVVRAYNIFWILVAQYLAAIYILSSEKSFIGVLLDEQFLWIVLATICVVAAGYIVNDFYDEKVDAINKPIKTTINALVSQKSKWRLYFTLNFVAFVLGFAISWRAAFFYAFYIFCIWLYSHKIQNYPVLKLLTISILDIFPFFVVLIYYKNISWLILYHGVFLYSMLLFKEIVKDLERDKGVILNDLKTISTIYSREKINLFILVAVGVMMFFAYLLLSMEVLGMMRYYFYGVLLLMPFLSVLMLWTTELKYYMLVHNLLKILLILGVVSLCLIDTSLIKNVFV